MQHVICFAQRNIVGGLVGCRWRLTRLHALQAECVEALLKAGCDLKAVAQDETSALHFAAQTGRTDVCRILLNAGVPHSQHVLQLSLTTRL